jgi:hypothetical protein
MDYRSEIYPAQNYEVIVDMRALEYVKENWETLELGKLYDANRPTGKKLVDMKQEPTLLLNFAEGYKRIDNGLGRRIDSYHQSKTNPRRMTTTGTSLQGISRVIRHTICRKTMYDFDIKNCHPVILRNWCEVKGVVSTHLQSFNENRADRFKDVQDVMSWSKDNAKTYVLRLTNGGGESGIENQDIMKTLTERLEWFGPFINELSIIRGQVMLHYPELLKKAVKAKGKDYYNLDGVVISYLLTNMENQILQCMVTACMKKKVKIASLIYDGFMVYKDCVPDINAFCLYLEQEVKDHTKHDVSIVEKEMEEGLVVPDDYKDSSQRSLEEKEKKKEEMLLEKKRKEQEKVQKKELEKEYKAQQKQLQKEAKEQDGKETDRELADLFLEEFEDKIKYDKNIGRGYFYHEKTRLWVEFTNFEALHDTIMSYCSLEQTKELRNVGYIVKIKLMNRMDDLTLFNMVKGVISLQDGMVYDMKRGCERPRVKEDYCSFFINHRYSEEYDRRWVINYIGELIGHSDALIEQFLELVGYSLSAENVLKLVIILLGEGDNGKSLLIEMIQSCMGSYQTVASSKIIKQPKFENNTHEAHLFALLNKRAAFSTELKDNDEFNCQALKQISGNDGISIRNSGSAETLSVTLKTVVWIATNQMAKITDPVFSKRLACIHFPNTFQRSATKETEIKSHSRDLFCAFMEGGHRFYQHNRQIELLPEIKEYTKKTNDKQDSFLQFMEENEFEVRNGEVEYCKDLYYFYSEFVKKTSMSAVGKETFYKRFEDQLHVTKLKNREGNYYSVKRI